MPWLEPVPTIGTETCRTRHHTATRRAGLVGAGHVKTALRTEAPPGGRRLTVGAARTTTAALLIAAPRGGRSRRALPTRLGHAALALLVLVAPAFVAVLTLASRAVMEIPLSFGPSRLQRFIMGATRARISKSATGGPRHATLSRPGVPATLFVLGVLVVFRNQLEHFVLVQLGSTGRWGRRFRLFLQVGIRGLLL
jgi:hypothetical protein